MKTARIAVAVIGAVAGVALMLGPTAPLGASLLGVSWATISAAAAVAGTALTLASKPKAANVGTQTSFKADPWAGIPYVMGETLVGGNIVYWEPHGEKNKYQSLVIVLSGAGPIEELVQTYLDKEQLDFDAVGGLEGTAIGNLMDKLWQDYQLGITPEASALETTVGTPPGWSTFANELSGMAGIMLTMLFDGKGDKTLTTTPAMGWRLKGVKVYDPRLDSTYPGGSGSCRALDEDTYVYDRNPYLHGLTWALGRWQNGVRVAGVGMPIDQIDVANFVEGANVSDANGWTCNGQTDSAADKWNDLKRMLAAGGGEPIRYGARLSCIVNAPKVVLDTIDYKQIVGEAVIPSMRRRRDRINGAIPSYRSEDHGWEVVAAGVVRNATYLAEDGAERTEEMGASNGLTDFVQTFTGETPDQAAQLAGYHVANSREAEPIVLPLKPRWIGYRIGDCLECDAEETNLAGRQLVVRGRSFDVEQGSVTLTLRTEDPDKHVWALGLSGDPAPAANPALIPTRPAPDAGAWALTAETITGSGTAEPMLVFAGAVDDPNAIQVVFEIAATAAEPDADDDGAWQAAEFHAPNVTRYERTGVMGGQAYWGAVSYRYLPLFNLPFRSERLILGPVTTAGGTGSMGRILLESGDRVLLETSDQLLLES